MPSISATSSQSWNLLFVRERIGEVREAVPKVHEALRGWQKGSVKNGAKLRQLCDDCGFG